MSRARVRPGAWAGSGNGNGNGAAAPPGGDAPGWTPPVAVPRGATPIEASVAVPVAAEPPASIPIRPVEPAEEAPAPSDAVLIRAAPPGGAGTISIGFESEVELERLLPAIESLTSAIRDRPGSLPVVINIPVAGATRQVRLPLHADWDERLAELLTRAAGVPLAVSLLAAAVEP